MNYYDSISEGYNNLHQEEQEKKLKIIKENLELKKNFLLLDVGCGTGISSNFSCKVIGIDPSIGLLKKNYNKNIINARSESLPFKEHTFDVVISVTAIQNFDDIKKGIGEIRRVGKKRFVLSTLKKTKKLEKIRDNIEQNFKIVKVIEEEKDLIFFLK